LRVPLVGYVVIVSGPNGHCAAKRPSTCSYILTPSMSFSHQPCVCQRSAGNN
jgi:hypothetical protein